MVPPCAKSLSHVKPQKNMGHKGKAHKSKKTKRQTRAPSLATQQASAQHKIADVALKRNMMRAMGLSYSPMMASVPYQTDFNQYNPGQKDVRPRPQGYLNPKTQNSGSAKPIFKDGKWVDVTLDPNYKQKIGLLPGVDPGSKDEASGSGPANALM